MIIRPATTADHAALWHMIRPVLAAGETYPLPRDMNEAAALDYWTAPDRQAFVAEADDGIVGTYYLRANQRGGGAHVANCGYITAAAASGRGVARHMAEHSLEQARACGFTAMQFNFVVGTNHRAIRLWHSLGFIEVGRLPGAFLHPEHGFTDALVMLRSL